MKKKNQKKKPLSGISLIMTGKKWIVLRPTEVIHVQYKVMFLSVAISLQLSFIVSIFSPFVHHCFNLQFEVIHHSKKECLTYHYEENGQQYPLWREWPTISDEIVKHSHLDLIIWKVSNLFVREMEEFSLCILHIYHYAMAFSTLWVFKRVLR